MGTLGLWNRTIRPVVLGFLLFGAGSVVGCEPCKPSKVSDTICFNSDCKHMPVAPVREANKAGVSLKCDSMIVKDPAMTCDPVLNKDDNMVLWLGERLMPYATGDYAQYCRYRWTGPLNNQDPDLLSPFPVKEDDCTFITPQADPFTEWANTAFLESLTGSPRPVMDETGLRTRVVVLDTSPFRGLSLPPIQPGAVSQHGETLAHLIQDIACGTDPQSCATAVRTRLVMPRSLNGGVPVFDDHGGNFGTLGDAVLALSSEIGEFRQELENAAAALGADPTNDARKMPTRLIFNESFAFGNTPGSTPCDEHPELATRLDVQTLFAAFRAASCLGGIHIAAAGNHTGGTSPSEGLLCPARWDKAVKPSAAICEEIFGQDAFKAIFNDFNKVTEAKKIKGNPFDIDMSPDTDALVSVGAVDHTGTAIVMTRPKACPEAVALGVGGVAWDRTASEPLVPPILSGTSVSAAVVSARLAVEWSQPSSPSFASEVVRQVVSSPDHRQRMQFITGGACDHLDSEVCDKVPWIGKSETRQWSPPRPTEEAMEAIASRSPNVFHYYKHNPGPVCPEKIPQCVRENASAASTLLWPQPPDPLCLRCGVVWLPGHDFPELWLDRSGDIVTEGNTIGNTVIKGIVLVIEDALGNVALTIPLENADVTENSTVKLDVGLQSLTGKRAWISAYDEKGNSFSQQIFVFP